MRVNEFSAAQLGQAQPGDSPAGASCACEDYRAHHTCDHVLRAAAVRMLHRMIDIHAHPEQPTPARPAFPH